jgi:hypothetical protein
MFTQSPFVGLQAPRRLWLAWALLILATAGMAAWVSVLGELLDQRLAHGVLSLELPWDEAGARQVLAELGDDGRRAARTQTLVDFGLLLLYPLAFALSCELLCRRLPERMARTGLRLQWALLLTGPLDAAENLCILLMLGGQTAAPLPQLSSMLATAKFMIIAAAVAFILLALVMLIPRRGWWLGKLIQLFRLHVLTLVSLGLGVYFFGYSQPARELWEDALGAPQSGALSLIVVAAFCWIASLWWAPQHAQLFFLADVHQRHKVDWPAAEPDAPDDHRRVRHLMSIIPAIGPLLGLVAIVFGAAASGLSESDKTAPALSIALLVAAALGIVAQWRWTSLPASQCRPLARQLALWQWAGAGFLAALAMAIGDAGAAGPLWALVSGIALPALIATLAAWWVARRPSRRRVVATAALRWLSSAILVLGSFDADGRLGIGAAVFVGVATVALEWGYGWLRGRSVPATVQARSAELAQWVTPAAGPRDGFAALLPLLLGAVAFALWPVSFGSMLGSLAVVMLALAAWTLNCAVVFISLPLRLGLGALPLLLPIWLLLISPFTDNHRLPYVSAAPSGTVASAALPAVPAREPSLRADLDFEAWLASPHRSEAASEPIFVVAASGGGIRAAYWTATVLARLDDQSCGEFGRQTYAISGVSGGSVGAAVYVAATRHVNERQAGAPAPCTPQKASSQATTGPIEQIVHSFFEQDLMAPLLGSMLFADGLQRFLPAVVPWGDRGRALEQALESAWFDLTAGRDFEQALTALYANDTRRRLPLLVLNATNVADGRRVQTAPVLLQDLLAYPLLSQELRTHGLRLSTAVHNSARFPLISPPGTVLRRDGSVAMRVVDGGYFENSAAAGATALYRAMRLPAGQAKRPIALVLIESDPALDEPSVDCGFEARRLQQLARDARAEAWLSRNPVPLPSDSPPLSDFGFELSSVLSALLGARSARGPWHQQELATLVCEEPDHRVLSFFYSNGSADDTGSGAAGQRRHPEPALSWALSRTTRAHMKSKAASLVQTRSRSGSAPMPF